MESNDFDVLIIGAGISGIGAACHLARECPSKKVAILERREAIGGTWDLFKYPGIRSDSDMFTFGFNFRPWTETKTLADGPAIKQYVIDTAREYGVDKKIHYGLKVTKAEWKSQEQGWTITAKPEDGGKAKTYRGNFLMLCTGYYNYDHGYKPEFKSEKDFEGQIVHPQHWPEDLDYAGKRVVIIGSGATAVTLLPAMADKTAHITMLQRSPTYMMSVPAKDPMASRLKGIVPEMTLYRMMRARNIAVQRWSFDASRRFPKQARNLIMKFARKQLGPDFDMRHFTPDYDPWDQRLCAMPNGDFYKILRSGKGEIVTDHIEKFTKKGILLKSGKELEADIIITATGLDVQMMGGAKLTIDGEERQASDTMMYKATLLEGIPNAGIVIGYTNASWTLRADLAAEYVCRLINHMDKKGYAVATPVDTEGSQSEETVMGTLTSGYVMRAAAKMPKQGSHGPWKVSHNYFRDIPLLRKSAIEDGYLQFERPRPKAAKKPAKTATTAGTSAAAAAN